MHTGDVGMFDYTKLNDEGQPTLSIVDRVKELEEIYWSGDSVWIQPTELEAAVYGSLNQAPHSPLAYLGDTLVASHTLGTNQRHSH